MPSRGMGLRYGSMEAEERALEGLLEHGAASGGAAPPREGERVVAARTDVLEADVSGLAKELRRHTGEHWERRARTRRRRQQPSIDALRHAVNQHIHDWQNNLQKPNLPWQHRSFHKSILEWNYDITPWRRSLPA